MSDWSRLPMGTLVFMVLGVSGVVIAHHSGPLGVGLALAGLGTLYYLEVTADG